MNQQFYKNLALWVVILVVMLLLFTTLKQNDATPPNIAFSEFMDSVVTGQVDSVTIEEGHIDKAMIDVEMFSKHLYTRYYPDPDLLIRTSGEMRVSNFLLWQISYAEIHVTKKLWPDFTKEDLVEAIRDYGSRQRRFGGL